MSAQDFLIALGSNAEYQEQSPKTIILEALDLLLHAGVVQVARSPFYATPAFPPGSGPEFVNAAAWLRDEKSPRSFLDLLHQVEAELGRKRDRRWGQRTLDLDLIAAGQCILPDRETFDYWRALAPDDQAVLAPDELILPHPRLQDRAFVLVPLCDIAANWSHPVLCREVRDLLFDLPQSERAAIRPL